MTNRMLFALFISLLFFIPGTDVEQSSDALTPSRQSRITDLHNEAEVARREAVSALQQFVAGDEQGEAIAAWNDNRAQYFILDSHSNSPVTWGAHTRPSVAQISVVIVDAARLDEMGIQYSSPTQYDPHSRQIFIPSLMRYSSVWRSAVLAHELLHAMEHEQGIISAFDPASATSQDAEIRAYEVEYRLLDRHSQGRLSVEIDRILDERGLIVGAGIEIPGRIQPAIEDLQQLAPLWEPVQSDEEQYARITAIQFFINHQFADRFGLGIEWKRQYHLYINRLIASRRGSAQ